MYDIVKTEFDFYKNQIGKEEIVKTVCSKREAERQLEVCFRSDSFTHYEIRES